MCEWVCVGRKSGCEEGKAGRQGEGKRLRTGHEAGIAVVMRSSSVAFHYSVDSGFQSLSAAAPTTNVPVGRPAAGAAVVTSCAKAQVAAASSSSHASVPSNSAGRPSSRCAVPTGGAGSPRSTCAGGAPAADSTPSAALTARAPTPTSPSPGTCGSHAPCCQSQEDSVGPAWERSSANAAGSVSGCCSALATGVHTAAS